jgi:DNA-nicking Smr family endonuclease
MTTADEKWDRTTRGRRRLKREDEDLWQEVTKSVRPLPRRAAPSALEPKAARKDVTGGSAGQNPAPPLSRLQAEGVKPPAKSQRSSLRPSPKAAPEPSAKLETRRRRKLKRGHLTIEATLDLHGLTESAAHAALKKFIIACRRRELRNVLVITGKGKSLHGATDPHAPPRGVLRTALPLWLREASLAGAVVAFDIADRKHGGAGAFYVQLRKNQVPRKPD